MNYYNSKIVVYYRKKSLTLSKTSFSFEERKRERERGRGVREGGERERK